jgi:hypothetical protein
VLTVGDNAFLQETQFINRKWFQGIAYEDNHVGPGQKCVGDACMVPV